MSACPPYIPSGELRSFVSVEREVRTPDGAGGYTVSWSVAFSFWSAVKQVSGTEKFAQQQLWPNGGAKFRARWPDVETLVETDRLLLDGKVYNVRHIADVDGWHSVGEITAERGVVQ